VLRAYALLPLLAAGCTRPAESRAYAELEVGASALTDVTVEIVGGHGAIHELADHRLELWANAPDIRVRVDVGATAAGDWTISARNVLTDAIMTEGGVISMRAPDQFPTTGVFRTQLAPGLHELRIAPPDVDVMAPFRVAAMADIQMALPEVDDMFEVISVVPDARFVICMGDITQRSGIEEYDMFDRQLQTLTIPFYTTLGNHELWEDHDRYFSRYGRASFQFEFKGTVFTFADSGDGGIDPIVEGWLDEWLEAAKDRTNVFLTHFPPIDPVGTRYGGFRSAEDGRRLLARLVKGNVDLTLYGHIHTLVEYENAGIPAYISGGGGAEPMKWDGIGRHFLLIDFVPSGVANVSVQRVD
jgi:predicted phosphodiesterase